MAGKRCKRKFNWDDLSSEEDEKVETKKVIKKEDKKAIEEQTKKLDRLSVDSKSKSNKSKSNDKDKEKSIEIEEITPRMTRGRKRSFDEANLTEAIDKKKVIGKNIKKTSPKTPPKSVSAKIESKNSPKNSPKTTPRSTRKGKSKSPIENEELKKEIKLIEPKIEDEIISLDIRSSITSQITDELAKRDLDDNDDDDDDDEEPKSKRTKSSNKTPVKKSMKQETKFQTPTKGKELKEDVSNRVLNILPDKNERRSNDSFINSEESSLPEINVKEIKIDLNKKPSSAKKFNKKHLSPATSPVKTKFKEVKIELNDEQRDWFQQAIKKSEGVYDKEFDIESNVYAKFRKTKY